MSAFLERFRFRPDRGRDAGSHEYRQRLLDAPRANGPKRAIPGRVWNRSPHPIALVDTKHKSPGGSDRRRHIVAVGVFWRVGGIVIGFYLRPRYCRCLPFERRPVIGLTVAGGGHGSEAEEGGSDMPRRCTSACNRRAWSAFSPARATDNPQLGFRSGSPMPFGKHIKADAQQQSLAWVLGPYSTAQQIIIDQLSVDGTSTIPANGSKSYPYAHWHWEGRSRSGLQNGVFRDDWRNVDYVVSSPSYSATCAPAS